MDDRSEHREPERRPDGRRHKHGRAGWIRVDGVEIQEGRTRRGERAYSVRIRGVNLRGAISPPRVEVGGQVLEEMSFAPDGRTLSGIVRDKPVAEHVVVDYGSVRAELREDR